MLRDFSFFKIEYYLVLYVLHCCQKLCIGDGRKKIDLLLVNVSKKITKVELITVEKHILYFYGDHSQTLALKTIGKLTAIKKDYQKLLFHPFHQFLC